MGVNLELAATAIQKLQGLGVREFCLCAGARNAPLVEVLSQAQGVKLYSHFEERSAAFFALGRAKLSQRPVVVVTTSGTAVAELLPAAIEAFYQGVPLIFLTADRPREYRGTAAPQTIEQVGIFGSYVETVVDCSAGENLNLGNWLGRGSLHLNLCFDEPLLDGTVPILKMTESAFVPLDKSEFKFEKTRIEEFCQKVKRPIVLLGGLEAKVRDQVLAHLLDLNLPVYAEALSGLRDEPLLQELLLKSGEKIFTTQAAQSIDAVIRIGHVPTLRLWRDLEASKKHLPTLSFDSLNFSGLSWDKNKILPFMALESLLSSWQHTPDWQELFAVDRQKHVQIQGLLEQLPLSEPSWVQRLSQKLPEKSMLFLGNSLPIRHWDVVASHDTKDLELFGNRGANGIDGLVSTFLGLCQSERNNYALIGDLSALYDLSGAWIWSQLDKLNAVLFVLNNGGGKIFSRVFNNPNFENNHSLGFSSWAEMFGLPYHLLDSSSANRNLPMIGPAICEIRPDIQQTEQFWNAYDQLWKNS